MATATGLPPPDTHNYAPTLLTVLGIFTVFSIVLCGARTISRLRVKEALRLDDYLIIIATVLCTTFYSLSIVSVKHGWGHHSSYVSPDNTVIAMRNLFIAMTIWIMEVALVRLSIAWSLLRLSTDRIWRWSLYAIIATQILLYIGHMVFQFFGCRPLRASWEPVYDTRCWPRHYVREFGWASAGILAFMDFVLAFMPIHLIRTLNRRTSEKILICFMMSLGMVAGAISSYKISISDKTFSGDLLIGTLKMAMWCDLEALLGIVAACVPCLKAPGERLLHRFGILVSRVEITRPSFVMSLQEQAPPQSSSSSDLPNSVPSSKKEKKGKKEKEKSVVSAIEVDNSVP